MAISGTIKLKIARRIRVSSFDILDSFFKNDWNLNSYEKIYYLPLGDVDYDWETVSSSKFDYVIDILKKKSVIGENIGVVLSFKNTEIGFTLLLNQEIDELSFDLDVNRKTIENMGTTDFSWYLSKIIPILKKVGLSIEIVKCIDG